MRLIPAILVTLLLISLARADDGEDTLKFFLGKSDIVLVATLLNTPSAANDALGVNGYRCEVDITEVLKGDPALKGKQSINVMRFEANDKDRTIKLEKGATFIFFLQQRGTTKTPILTTVDPWFSVQPPSPWMARSLARLAIEMDKPPKPASPTR